MRKIALCFALVFASLAASSGQSYAAGPLHQYFWDTSSHAGNGAAHAGVDMVRNGVFYFNRTVWEQNDEGGETMWYGPKDDVQGGVDVQVCWYYTRPAYFSSVVVFDITNSSPAIIMYSTGNKTLSALGVEPSIWTMEQFCHTVSMPNPLYTKFQVRVRAVSIHYDPNNPQANALKVYKTSYQAL